MKKYPRLDVEFVDAVPNVATPVLTATYVRAPTKPPIAGQAMYHHVQLGS
jgi:hypothetical protein